LVLTNPTNHSITSDPARFAPAIDVTLSSCPRILYCADYKILTVLIIHQTTVRWCSWLSRQSNINVRITEGLQFKSGSNHFIFAVVPPWFAEVCCSERANPRRARDSPSLALVRITHLLFCFAGRQCFSVAEMSDSFADCSILVSWYANAVERPQENFL
jgi:hypothetical protein